MWPFKKEAATEKIEAVEEPKVVVPIETKIEVALSLVSRVGDYIVFRTCYYEINAFHKKSDEFLHIKVVDNYSENYQVRGKNLLMMEVDGGRIVAEAVLKKIITLLNE